MPSTLLFAINHEGRVFGLSTSGTEWRQFVYQGLSFKQLSAVPNFLYAVGGDGHIYVNVHGLDLPIRVKEIAYENERWNPLEGFSGRLLPIDRYHFSNADGSKDRTLDNVQLPSMAWQWEEDWRLQLTLCGQPLDLDGWTYANEFLATYYPKKCWSSYVRRRKWVRYRSYNALNSWCAIPSIPKNPTMEHFIGVSVGGNQIPGGKSGMILVWAVTSSGRVMFRTGVSCSCPEGESWSEITMPQDCQVRQISVGPTGLVWVVTWNGKALVRTGITRGHLKGESWIEVELPGENLLLKEISVGYNGLWAITRNDAVWFRKGMKGQMSGISKALARGSGWVEIIGSMASVSVSSNDQVWAVGADDMLLYFRTGVTKENLTGKTWRLIKAPIRFGNKKEETESLNEVNRKIFVPDGFEDVFSAHEDVENNSEALWSWVEAGACKVSINNLPDWFGENYPSEAIDITKPWRIKILDELKSRAPGEKREKAVEVIYRCSPYVKTGNAKCLYPGGKSYEDCTMELEWVSGGEHNVDYGNLVISGLSTSDEISVKDIVAVVRCSKPDIPRLGIFKINTFTPMRLQFEDEYDVEDWLMKLSSVSGAVRGIADPPGPNSIWMTTALGDIFVCDLDYISMEQCPSENGNYSIEVNVPNPTMPFELALHSGFLPGSYIIIHGCAHDTADRFAIDLVCANGNRIPDIAFHLNPRFNEDVVVRNARKNSVWGPEDRRGCQPFTPGSLFELKILCDTSHFRVFVNGKIFTNFALREPITQKESPSITPAHVTHLACSGDMSINKIQYSAPNVIMQPGSMFWRPIKGHLRKVESAGGVTWGISFDGTAWVYTGAASSTNQKIAVEHNYYVYENKVYRFPNSDSPVTITQRFTWSDVTGMHKRTKEGTKLLSKKWQWVSDWSIDFNAPGGVDTAGWQYAEDFPSSYHRFARSTDHVMRRRWVRRARLETEGPWTEICHTPLLDCNLLVDGDKIVAWAVGANGYVLYRRGVTKTCPAGLSWEHVTSDQEMISISSAPNQVWTIGKSGTAFYRVGITASNPLGTAWEVVQSPRGSTLKQISIGDRCVWALDAKGRLWVRKDVTPEFPEGCHWQSLPLHPADKTANDEYGLLEVEENTEGFRYFSARSKLWAITRSGELIQRLSINAYNPTGSTWSTVIKANCLHISS